MAMIVMTWDVLQQRATECDVDHLLAAADAEDRHALLCSCSQQRYLREVERDIHIRCFPLTCLTICRGVDVPTAWDQQTVNAVNYRDRLVVWKATGQRSEHHRQPACGLDGAKVR